MRFSLRTLLFATALVAILFAIPVRRAILQKRGRDWVASQKGHVTFSHQYDEKRNAYDHQATLRTPAWIINLVGIDFIDSVDTVVLDNTMLEDLSPITDLRDLRVLGIIIEIDDELDFSPLGDLTKLRHLYLDYTDISAERLAQLRKTLPQVRVDATNHPNPTNSK